MSSLFQFWVSGIQRSEILCGKVGTVMGRLRWPWISFQTEHHSVDQMLESPLWIWIVQLWTNISLICITEDQKADFVELLWASQKLVLGKHLALSMLVRIGFLPVTTFQAAWRIRLRLTVSRSRTPKPPSLLGLQISFYDLKWKEDEALSSWTPAHQKLRIIVVILEMKVLENKMVDM